MVHGQCWCLQNRGSKNCRDTGANCLLLMAGDGLIGKCVDLGTDDGGIAQVIGRDDGTDCCTCTGVEGCQVVGRDDGTTVLQVLE